MSDDKREAWEILAPELPPGWRIFPEDEDTESPFNWVVTTPGHERVGWGIESRGHAVGCAWSHFGTPRKQYAEDIAPRLVREAAESKRVRGLAAEVCHTWECVAGRESHTFTIEIDRRAEEEFTSNDICTAVLACIRAMEGE